MKRQFVEKLKAGEAVDDVFVLAEKALYQKRDGNPYLNATFSDRSGSIKGVLWDRVEEIAPTVAAGDFVAVKGSVGEYKGSLQLVAKSIRPCPAESISPADFLPTGQRDPDKMFERLSQLTQSLEAPWLKALVAAFWQDAEFLRRF
ncbi:MAG: OB-fold nucleic acid binding domain-containing protein, partial [Desulfobacteraceae bacterium]